MSYDTISGSWLAVALAVGVGGGVLIGASSQPSDEEMRAQSDYDAVMGLTKRQATCVYSKHSHSMVLVRACQALFPAYQIEEISPSDAERYLDK